MLPELIRSMKDKAGPLATILELFDDKFGPFGELVGLRLQTPEPSWWVYTCKLGNIPAGSWFNLHPNSAAGSSISEEQALIRCLGEAVERYSGLYSKFHDSQLKWMKLEESAIYPRLPVCSFDEKCGSSFRQREPSMFVQQTEMFELISHKRLNVPAPLVHLGFVPEKDEPLLMPPISTGIAFHTVIANAIWSAICEIAERDAMMLMWILKKSAPKIDIDKGGVPEELAIRILRLKRVGLTVSLHDITNTTFGICTIFCVIRSDQYPYIVVGAAANSNPEDACVKAIDEAVSIRVFAHGRLNSRDKLTFSNFDWVCQLEDHATLYAHWKNSPAFSFLDRQDAEPYSWADFNQYRKIDGPCNLNDVKNICKKLSKKGLTILWKDITAPDVLQYGNTVRVVIPEAVPLAQSFDSRWLDCSRIKEETTGKNTEINPYPHPFS